MMLAAETPSTGSGMGGISAVSAVERNSLDNSLIESQELGECTWTG
jgi:hypothetical protein